MSMERRPSSAASSSNVAAPAHKRTDSRVASGQSTLAVYVRNLRLLDLDTLPDWPSITPSSFGNHDARARMRCVEWSLYQLFSIYDPTTTAEKLQPFFPPLEPLQSINLRAALYRCLNDLKKNGVLGRETVLRKSMLDDCQGDKFFEVCLAFSAVVLRQVKVDSNDGYGQPIAEQMGAAQSLSKSQRDSMLPLAIAHKAALTKLVSTKSRKREAYTNLSDMLADKEFDLQQRKAAIREQRQDTRGRAGKPSFAEEVVDKSWVGSDEVRDVLVNGDEAAGGDGVLLKSFDTLWHATEQNRLFSQQVADTGVLEDLENRAQQQRRRLQKWQVFHERLLNAKKAAAKKSGPSTKAAPLRLDQHQNMTLRDMDDLSPTAPSPTKRNIHVSAAKYDDILTAMREELRKKSSTAEPSPSKSPANSKRPFPKRQSMSQDSTTGGAPPEHHHERSHSQTSVPVRPGVQKRVSSRSRSYHQPKIFSQREPIPLKSEIFSPLATKRLGSMSPSSSRSMSLVASPTDDVSSEVRMQDILDATSRRMRQNSDLTESSFGHGRGSPNTSHTGSGTNSPMRKISTGEQPDNLFDLPMRVNPTPNIRPSLADRTRMSMAFKSSDDFTSVIPQTNSPQRSPDLQNSPTPHDTRRRATSTLQDRTRQSILTSTPQPPIINFKPSHTRARTSTFPVNQFETPRKGNHHSTYSLDAVATQEAPSEQDVENAPATITGTSKRNFTPREELFDQDAEYASVFKARPKIALSPVVSPALVDSKRSSVMNDLLLDGRGGLEAGIESPLAGR
ncbi:unnamed protein product [Zymoseptoria tritici ST99CH_3D1]|nr:unnamed protein product [Zymoseptoria tritici ST99CH_3D1]